ncbi:dnaJ homolog subfamily C member 24 isoform X2 [Nelusetta ayraudi]|uniref:dnaJ homolog subfamily C member 24 isoform X2 n=1 Tax=Nelusetta ayraudi TaxID=303726 RepID=UPI003F6E4FBE
MLLKGRLAKSTEPCQSTRGMCEVLEKDLYAVLGARPSDSALQLKHRYQQLALQYHPDRLRLKEPSAVDSTSEKFLEIEAAWRVLSDQNTRQQYDLQCKAQELKQNWPLDSTISVENMRWDPERRMHTDTCRCGGVFSITQEEVEEERRREWSDEEEETGLYVCCDSCSLCVCVKISVVAHNNDNK